VEQEDWTKLPLHVKPVRPLNLQALRNLEVTDGQVRERFNEAARWITEDGMYAKLPSRGYNFAQLERAKLDASDIQKMAEADQVVEIRPEEARGVLHLFAVPELAKGRRRAIKHTRDINERFDKSTLVPCFMPTRAEQSKQAATGKFAISLDFAAWFDQFELAPAVSRRMCFRSSGKAWALTRMPMGQRHAVAIAQGATNILLSFAYPPSVSSQSCIDNVRFVGPKAGVISAATTFVRRCRQVGVTINELPREASVSQLEGLVHQQGDWLGAEYDYAAGKQRVAAKTMTKLHNSWARRDTWTHRQYAAHLGLLFFTASVLRSPLASYYEAIKQLRLRSAALSQNMDLWATPVSFAEGERDSLARWTSHALANTWSSCASPAPTQRFLITDASGWGWGAMFMDTQSGLVRSHGQPWSNEDRLLVDTDASTSAEPEAVLQALRRFIAHSDAGVIAVLTDSTTAKYALGKGYSPSFVVNAIAARVRASFPNLRLEMHHIAGESNPVDGLSRNGSALQPSEARVAAELLIAKVRGEPSAV
jgi:hypothetical protein